MRLTNKEKYKANVKLKDYLLICQQTILMSGLSPYTGGQTMVNCYAIKVIFFIFTQESCKLHALFFFLKRIAESYVPVN